MYRENDELDYFHNKYLKKSNHKDRIDIRIGEAKKLINKLDITFDLIFLDADKESYPDYYDMLIPILNPNGILLADNVLWYEKVLSQPAKNDLATMAIQSFNKKVKEDPNVNVTILPIRDGLSIIKKIG